MTFTESLNNIASGARFYRADLHIHSFGASHDVRDNLMTPQAIVDTALQEGLDVISITDHNEISNVEAAINASQGKELLVIPGVELSTPEGHFLAYLPTLDALQRFYAKLDIAGRGTSDSRCQTATLACLELLKTFRGVGILAHVDVKSGFEIENPDFKPHKIDILCHPNLLGIEVKLATSDIFYTDTDVNSERVKVCKERIERLKLGAKQFLARVLNSDSHNLKTLGHNANGDKRITRIKMDKPSFWAFKSALEDADARIRIEDNIPLAVPHILGISFDGGFLDKQAIHFNRNLNCIIGGRGTGKSTTFEAIRCLSVGGSQSKVVDSEVWPANINFVWRDAAGQIHSLSRIMGGTCQNDDNPHIGPVSFEMDCFGQGEAAKISEDSVKNPLALLNYLDKFTDVYDAQREESESCDKLLALQSEVERANVQVQLIPQTERNLKITEQQLQALHQANASEVIDLQRKIDEERVVRTNISVKLGELKDTLSASLPSQAIADIKNLTNVSDLKLGGDEYTIILTKADDFLASVGGADKQLKADFLNLDKAINEQLTSWKSKELAALSQIEVKRKDLESKGIRLDMAYIQKLSREEASYRQNLINLKTWVPHHADQTKLRNIELANRWRLRERVANARVLYGIKATEILKESLSDLTVTLKYLKNGCSPAGAALITQTMGWRTNQVPRADILVERMTIPKLLEAIAKNRPQAIADIALDDGTKVFDNAEAVQIIEKLKQPEIVYALERIEIHDLPRLTVTKVLKEPGKPDRVIMRDFSQLSLGQKQSILLALMLSAASTHPLIIDQPEDNLDSEFIYGTLVPVLRRAKERRQIIVITHNANIAVLGDVEQLIVLKGNNVNARIVSRGAIDELQTREMACNVLEGAQEAFTRRGKTYGYEISPPIV